MDMKRPIDDLAKDIFHEVMRRMKLPHTWDSPDTLKRRWIAVAEFVRDLMVQIPSPVDEELRSQAEKMAAFVNCADLGSCSLSTQREARERVWALRRALKGK